MFRHVRWAVPFVAALAPIMLMTVYADRVTVRSLEQIARSQQLSVASGFGQHISRETTKMASLATAFASVEGTVNAVEQRDAFVVSTRMKALIVAYPALATASVIDASGTLLAEYPSGHSAWKNIPWMGNVRNIETQVFSPGYRGGSGTMIAIVTPVPGSQGGIAGHMIAEVPADRFEDWLATSDIPDGGDVLLADNKGVVVVHSRHGSESLMLKSINLPSIATAISGSAVSDYAVFDGIDMLVTLQPVEIGSSLWLSVVRQPKALALNDAQRVRILLGAGGVVLTLVTLWLVVALARASVKILHLNRDLEDKNKKLQEADKMKDDFISFVSHQLKAPVTSIRLGVEALLKEQLGHLPEGALRILTQLKDISAQSFKLITDLLNTSRINRGVIEVELADIALGDIAERAVRDYRVIAEQAGLTLTLNGADKHITVHADKEKMGEAVSNAVSNAIKHTRQGGITLTMYENDGYGCIDVTDTGEGMPPDVISKLFTRDQIFGASAHAEHSAGLGLYIAKHFMALQKGDVSVTSEVGKGSTFTYRVPLGGSEEVRK